jgi:small subunit ribosomal protein S3
MGQKIHPTGFRLAVTRDWSSRWYANSKNFAGMLNEDLKVRDYLKKKLKHASVGRVSSSARPRTPASPFLGPPGCGDRQEGRGHRSAARAAEDHGRAGACQHRRNSQAGTRCATDRRLDTQQLEKRIMFRRAMKRAMQNAMRLGAQGIKIMSSGRLNGAEIAVASGIAKAACRCTPCVPTSITDLEALTTYGIIGRQGLGVQGRDSESQRAAVAAPEAAR